MPNDSKRFVDVHGKQLTDEEKKLLVEYTAAWLMEMKRRGLKPNIVDTYLSGFYAGIGHAGTHFREEIKP